MTKITNIQNLFNEHIIDKDDFFEKCAIEFEIEKSSVRANWFSRFEIPSKRKNQENLITFMQNYIKVNGSRS